ncbi:MAG: hypothetical protein JWO76_3557, partial [Nocardioides sp.]|nr:hypothetical protein [Nocardioides sp.]
MTIGAVSGFQRSGVLHAKRRPSASLYLEPELAVRATYTCYDVYNNTPWGSFPTGFQNCVSRTTGDWTGDLKRAQTSFASCNSGAAKPIILKTGRGDTGVSVSEGTV